MKKLLLTALLLGMTSQNLPKDLEGTLLKYKSEIKVESMKEKEENWCDSIPRFVKYKSLKPGSCSLYVLLAGKDLFDKEYTWSDSWDRRYNDKLLKAIDKEKPFEEIKNLIEDKTLKPGMVLGVYNPGSGENYKKDSRGKLRKYTHVLLYVGKDKTGDYVFFHNYGRVQEKITLDDAKKRGFVPREIIDSRDS